MKTKEELAALKEEVASLNKKLEELSEEELTAVTGGVIPIIFASTPGLTDKEGKHAAGSGPESGDLSSGQLYTVMFNYITAMDEYHAVYVYRSRGFLLDAADRMKVRSLFKGVFGYDIEESPYYQQIGLS